MKWKLILFIFVALVLTNYWYQFFSFSIRVFSVAAVICTILVLPVNYYGRDRIHKNIPFESLEVFTIENVKEGSEWYEPVTFILNGNFHYVKESILC